jgi:predicted dehydrogenase
MERIGIIGGGSIVDLYYIQSMRRLGFKSIYLFDINKERQLFMVEKHGIISSTIDDIKKDCATIIITTPIDAHFALCFDLIGKDKHIICEKPFLLSVKEFDLLSIQAKEQNCQLSVAHIRRIFPAISLAEQLLKTAPYGKLKEVKIVEGGRMSYKTSSNYTLNHPLGGVLADTGSHALDSFLFLTNQTHSTLSISNLSVQTSGKEPSHHAVVKMNLNGVNVNMELSRLKPLANKITLHYECGKVEVPMGIKPNIIVTSNNSVEVRSADHFFHYMSEAFLMELYELLILKNRNQFGLDQFRNTSLVLEKIYQAL